MAILDGNSSSYQKQPTLCIIGCWSLLARAGVVMGFFAIIDCFVVFLGGVVAVVAAAGGGCDIHPQRHP